MEGKEIRREVRHTAPPSLSRTLLPCRLLGTRTLKWIAIGEGNEKQGCCQVSLCHRIAWPSPALRQPARSQGRPDMARHAPARSGALPSKTGSHRVWGGCVHIPMHICYFNRVFLVARRGTDTQACAHPSRSLPCLFPVRRKNRLVPQKPASRRA